MKKNCDETLSIGSGKGSLSEFSNPFDTITSNQSPRKSSVKVKDKSASYFDDPHKMFNQLKNTTIDRNNSQHGEQSCENPENSTLEKDMPSIKVPPIRVHQSSSPSKVESGIETIQLQFNESQQKRFRQNSRQEYQEQNRLSELNATAQILNRKIAIIWIFVTGRPLDRSIEERIKTIYGGYQRYNYLVPLCKKSSEAAQFLTVPDSLFKIVADLDNIEDMIKYHENKNILSYYIYNADGQSGFSRALAIKQKNKKIKGIIFINIQRIMDEAEEEIQVKIFKTQNGDLKLRKKPKLFPSFIKLSGQDKTQATLYRINLYGAIKIQCGEKRQAYHEFQRLIIEKYGSQDQKTQNIIDYSKLNHFAEKLEEKDARQVIKFYVRESFYYEILNSMLRTMKTTSQFKPCILPFYENYHAIKMFYMKDLLHNNRVIQPQILYRGTRLKKRCYDALKPNQFIEMLGFMSASKNLETAMQFADPSTGYIFVIHVPKIKIPQKFDKYDHGFVDINRHRLADRLMQKEEQVLFNGLNIYKVLKIQQNHQGFKMIHIQYGSIFNLLSQTHSSLSTTEKDVLINYQYCSNLFKEIQDQGDVYLYANEFEKAKKYYSNKIENERMNSKYYLKLANVLQQCGELADANDNAKKSKQIQKQKGNLDKDDREMCLKIFSIHYKNAQISLDNEDYLEADEDITNALELVPEDNIFEKAKKIEERGEIKFKKGQIKDSENDFEESEKLFKSLTQQAEQKKKQIYRDYLLSCLTLLCGRQTQSEILQKRDAELKQVEELEIKIDGMKNQIKDQLIKVNNSLKEVAIYTNDKKKYQKCVKKARGYLIEVREKQTDDPREKAKLKVMEATIQDFLQLAQSQKLLYQAIQLVESGQKLDPVVGKYANILANLQKKELQTYSENGIRKKELTAGMEKIKYDEKERKSIYQRCKKNYEKTLNVLLSNKKQQCSPEVLNVKNQIAELEYNESNYVDCEKIIKQVKEEREKNPHSQISKSCLLLSKISYARGELKEAFINVEECDSILKEAIIKKDETRYQLFYQNHQIHQELVLHRAKIYMSQMKHDLSIKELDSLKITIDMKEVMDKQSLRILADIYELKAEVLACNDLVQDDDFLEYFKKARKTRVKQMGNLNWPNAVCYCNQAKYMILFGELEEAKNILDKARQIFGCFSAEHPLTWLIFYCDALYNQKEDKISESINNFEKCLELARRNFDEEHISINKIRFHFAKMLQKVGKHQKAVSQFKKLQSDLSEKLSLSSTRCRIQSENDDEKVSLQQQLQNLLRDCSNKSVNQSRNSDDIMAIGPRTARLEESMINLGSTYRFKGSEPQ